LGSLLSFVCLVPPLPPGDNETENLRSLTCDLTRKLPVRTSSRLLAFVLARVVRVGMKPLPNVSCYCPSRWASSVFLQKHCNWKKVRASRPGCLRKVRSEVKRTQKQISGRQVAASYRKLCVMLLCISAPVTPGYAGRTGRAC